MEEDVARGSRDPCPAPGRAARHPRERGHAATATASAKTPRGGGRRAAGPYRVAAADRA